MSSFTVQHDSRHVHQVVAQLDFMNFWCDTPSSRLTISGIMSPNRFTACPCQASYGEHHPAGGRVQPCNGPRSEQHHSVALCVWKRMTSCPTTSDACPVDMVLWGMASGRMLQHNAVC